MFSKKGPVSLSTLSPLSRGLQQQHEQRQQPTLMPMLQPRPLANAQQGFTSVQSFGSASVVAPSQSQRQHTLFVPDAAQASNTQPQPLPLPPQHQPAHPSCHTPQDSHYLQPACNAGIQHPQYQHHPVGEGVPPGPLPLPKPTTSSSPATVAPGTWSAGIKTADSRHSSHAANVNTLTPAASAAPAGPPTPRQQAPSAPQHSFPSPHSLPLPHPPAPNTPPQQHDQAQPVPPVLEPSHPTPSSIPSVGRLPPSPPSFCSPAPATALPTSSACQPSTSPMSFPAEPTPAQYVYVTRASRAPEPAVPSVRSSAAPGPLEQEQQDPDHVAPSQDSGVAGYTSAHPYTNPALKTACASSCSTSSTPAQPPTSTYAAPPPLPPQPPAWDISSGHASACRSLSGPPAPGPLPHSSPGPAPRSYPNPQPSAAPHQRPAHPSAVYPPQAHPPPSQSAHSWPSYPTQHPRPHHPLHGAYAPAAPPPHGYIGPTPGPHNPAPAPPGYPALYSYPSSHVGLPPPYGIAPPPPGYPTSVQAMHGTHSLHSASSSSYGGVPFTPGAVAALAPAPAAFSKPDGSSSSKTTKPGGEAPLSLIAAKSLGGVAVVALQRSALAMGRFAGKLEKGVARLKEKEAKWEKKRNQMKQSRIGVGWEVGLGEGEDEDSGGTE